MCSDANDHMMQHKPAENQCTGTLKHQKTAISALVYFKSTLGTEFRVQVVACHTLFLAISFSAEDGTCIFFSASLAKVQSRLVIYYSSPC